MALKRVAGGQVDELALKRVVSEPVDELALKRLLVIRLMNWL